MKSKQEIDEIFDKIDVDKSNSITFNEFVAAAMDKEKVICHD